MWEDSDDSGNEEAPNLSPIPEDEDAPSGAVSEYFLTLTPSENLGLLVRGRDAVHLAGFKEGTQAARLGPSALPPGVSLRVSSINGEALGEKMPAADFVVLLARERQAAVEANRLLTVGFTPVAVNASSAAAMASPAAASLSAPVIFSSPQPVAAATADAAAAV